jgi:hypothetical protein
VSKGVLSRVFDAVTIVYLVCVGVLVMVVLLLLVALMVAVLVNRVGLFTH